MRRLVSFGWLSTIIAGLIPAAASAHEVYVLGQSTISHAISTPSQNPFITAIERPDQFIFWGIVSAIVVSTVFALSISHWLEKLANPFLRRCKPFAAPIARFTLGACLILSATHGAFFGPELPLTDFGSLAPLLTLALIVSGALIFVGLYTRIAAGIAGIIFAVGVMRYGIYLGTYANYLGEIVLVGILGSGRYSLERLLNIRHSKRLTYWAHRFEPYAFPLMRFLFGVAIVFAAVYAKFWYSNLGLEVVLQYHLTDYFHFDPLFIVLGALIIETLGGLFVMFGFEIRHTGLFFLFWLTLSLLYFGENVWPHLLLFGVIFALFCHGYDRYSIQGYFFKHDEREPVL